jgi:hypothetical protein
MNQQQTYNEQLMISPPGHENGAPNSIKLNHRNQFHQPED